MKKALKFNLIEGGTNPAFEYVKISNDGYIYTTNGVIVIKASIKDSCGKELADTLIHLAGITGSAYIMKEHWYQLTKAAPIKVKNIEAASYHGSHKKFMYINVGYTPKRISVFTTTDRLLFGKYPDCEGIIERVKDYEPVSKTFSFKTDSIKAIRKCLSPIAKNVTLECTPVHNYIRYTVPNYDITIVTQ